MSISIIIAHEDQKILNTDYFVQQLKEKWPEVKIHFISDPNAPLLQFRTGDSLGHFGVLGSFSGTGVSYTTSGGRKEDAHFALWYRSIVPAEWQLSCYDSGLYFDIMLLTTETTAEQIIKGFEIPFDISKYQ